VESKFHGYQKNYTEYHYDSKGNMVESTIHDASETLIGRTIQEFSEDKLISSEHFEAILSQGQIQHYTDYYTYE
jgi:hypothetical protein